MQTKHDVKVLIDARELELIALFNRVYPQGNPELDFTQNLRYGDVQILVDGQLNMIIERKRNDDFRSSVTGYSASDIPIEELNATPAPPVPTPASVEVQKLYPKRKPGRFRKQRANLILQRRENPGVVVMFIFEGRVEELYYGPNAKVKSKELLELQHDLTFKYGIPIMFVRNSIETLRCIGRIRDICAKYGSAEQCCNNVTEEGTASMGTKKNITGVESLQMNPGQFLGRSLVTVHGMTPEKAHVIVEKYHNLPNLFKCYSNMKTMREKKHMLADYKTHDTGKRFGPKLSERVYLSLFGKSDSELPEKAVPKRKPPTRTLDTLAEVAVKVQGRRHVLDD